MGRYALQRIALAAPVLLGVLLIGFLLMQVVPTDPATVRAGPQATAEVVAAIRTAKQFLTYVNGGPFQPAIALGLGLPDSFYDHLAADLQAKRDRLMPGLLEAGFTVFPTQSTYFVTVDIRPLQPDGDGMAFCRALPHRVGVVAIPTEVMYVNKHEGRHLVRFAFCKQLSVLDDAVERLQQLG